MAIGFCATAALPACGKKAGPPRGAATPEEAFQGMYDAIRQEDVDALWALYSDVTIAQLEEMKTALLGMPPEAFQQQFGLPQSEIVGLDTKALMARMMRTEVATKKAEQTPVIDRIETTGPDTARILFRNAEAECRQAVRRIDGRWLIDENAACREEARPAP
ncbi:MAG: hypothetical protein HY905_08735 [Deltaproteobacteria bacterium]|nr:hypothetical protein [Deltaproteobacteria bacterium]